MIRSAESFKLLTNATLSINQIERKDGDKHEKRTKDKERKKERKKDKERKKERTKKEENFFEQLRLISIH